MTASVIPNLMLVKYTCWLLDKDADLMDVEDITRSKSDSTKCVA